MTAFAHRTDKVTGSAIRELFKLLGDPEIISFGGGNPAKESFPVETVRKLTDSLLQEKGTLPAPIRAHRGLCSADRRVYQPCAFPAWA